MPNFTKEQELAITKSGMNIIVSAGAGSGKTAVLTERVIRKLKNGEDVSRLLILTFTNAAAKEMKERIRKAIKDNGLFNELLKLDSSYITTFDSFALQIVKKYHYLLDLDKDIAPGNSLILKFQKESILDNIFEELYQSGAKLFLKLITDFTIRDDAKLKTAILRMYDKIDLKYDKVEYLKNYIEKFYNDEYLDLKIQEFSNLIFKKIQEIKENLEEIELNVDGDFYFEFKDSLAPLISSNDYDTIVKNLDLNLPRLKKGMTAIKPYKDKIANAIKSINKMCIYDSLKDIKSDILKTKDYVEIIIEILLKLDSRLEKFKEENSLYDFTDISKLAIKIVDLNEDVRLELKNYFHEILIDEYQDTSDLQELFISKIENDNVYMVGDIKQSIYRFRNANPNLFKNKYNNYQKNIGGFKIDLLKNFRSREETLNNINYIFNYIMDLELGGADYKSSHQMIFGNTSYSEFKEQSQDNNFEIYNYEVTDKTYSKDEIEAFITVSDIINKVKNKYQVYDKNINNLRDITYDDFVILIDKSTNFELYKKIFEYKGVNLTILKDESITGSYDLLILKNILVLLKNVKNHSFNKEFKYAYLSIGRSYLFNLSDKLLYENITNSNFQDDIIIKKIQDLVKEIDLIPVNLLIDKIIEKFDFYERLITVGNIQESIIRLDYIVSLATDLSNLGYTYLDVLEYLNRMIENNEEIKYSLNKDIKNSVKIMTIHKSKGLEYHVCYYTGLTNKFNVMEAKEKFLFDNKYGIITPNYDNGIKPTIYHTLYKENYLKEDISERIRLFYVALTRAKEKMILITSLKDTDSYQEEDLVDLDTRLKYTSFAGILNSISDKLTPYIKNIDLSNYNLTKDYNIFKSDNIKDKIVLKEEKIKVSELNIENKILDESKFSKTNLSLITKEEKKELDFGTYLHYLLEITDFKNIDYEIIPEKYRDYLKKIMNLDLFKNIKEANIFKEYEFIYTEDNVKKHGVIDLMLEYNDHIDIIDYKLKNIDDLEYDKQLKGYFNYIKTKSDKKINLYLYSIIDSKYRQII